MDVVDGLDQVMGLIDHDNISFQRDPQRLARPLPSHARSYIYIYIYVLGLRFLVLGVIRDFQLRI